jgi:hypothetical protein
MARPDPTGPGLFFTIVLAQSTNNQSASNFWSRFSGRAGVEIGSFSSFGFRINVSTNNQSTLLFSYAPPHYSANLLVGRFYATYAYWAM